MFSSGSILPLNPPYSELGQEKRYGAGFIKKFQPKTCFLGWTKLHSGTLLPPIVQLVRLAKKIGEVRFSKKILTENVFFGKKISVAYEANEAKFSCEIVLPPNKLNSPCGPENR